MTATLGDFISLASSDLQAVAAVRDLPSPAIIAATGHLRSVALTLSKYLTDTRSFPSPRAPAAASDELGMAAASLSSAVTSGARVDRRVPHPVSQQARNAATALSAGLDLLASHTGLDPDGNTLPRTQWAAALASPHLKAAMLAEIGDLAKAASSACNALSSAHAPQLPADSRKALRDAAVRFSRITPVAIPHDPDRSGQALRPVLLATPASVLPARHPPQDNEDLHELCQGMETSAERIRRHTWQPAPDGLWPPQPTVANWRWSATAAAITGHLAGQILTGLADRTRTLLPDISGLFFTCTTISMTTSWNAWHHASATASTLTDTAALDLASPVQNDLSDLMIRTGRLAHASPGWTPAASNRGLLKDPPALAPDLDDLRTVLAAVHHAADALAYLGVANVRAIEASARTTHIFPAFGSPATGKHIPELAGIYQIAGEAARNAAEALDTQASVTGTPTTTLGFVRSANSDDPDNSRFRLAADLEKIQPGSITELCRISFPSRPLQGRRGPSPAIPTQQTVARQPHRHV